MLPISLRDHGYQDMGMREGMNRIQRVQTPRLERLNSVFSGSLLVLTLWFNKVGRHQVSFPLPHFVSILVGIESVSCLVI